MDVVKDQQCRSQIQFKELRITRTVGRTQESHCQNLELVMFACFSAAGLVFHGCLQARLTVFLAGYELFSIFDLQRCMAGLLYLQGPQQAPTILASSHGYFCLADSAALRSSTSTFSIALKSTHY
jgi:hypothetical protein